MNNLKFSIIIPVKSINKYLRNNITKIKKINYQNWELIILIDSKENNIWQDKRIRLFPTGKIPPGRKRDIGSKFSTGNILVFLDDDSYPHKDLLRIANKEFISQKIVAIGGPGITPDDECFFGRVSGSVFLSKYSGGNPDRYLPIGGKKKIDDWPSVNFMIRKKIFERIGGFNTNFWPGEDTFLCWKILNNVKGIILYHPKMIVYHYRRSNILSHLKQVKNYAQHRGHFAKIYPATSRKFFYFLPSFFVSWFCLFLISLLFKVTIIKFIFFSGIIFYLCVLFKSVIDIKKYESYLVCFFSIPYILLTHFSYGIYFLIGFFKKNLKSKLV